MKEELFKGSVLETEIRNATGFKLSSLYTLISSSYESQPDSKFWKDALEFIEARI